MPIIQRKWTPESADEMHKEDWFAIIFSVIAYIALLIGTAMSALLIPAGFFILIIGILATIIMYWIIDPKLRATSSEYEKQEKDYLLKLEEIQNGRRINDPWFSSGNWYVDCLYRIICGDDICIYLL